MVPKRKALLWMGLVLFAAILIPFWFWHGAWFGRPLTEEEMGDYFRTKDKPRKIQHALVQVEERIRRGDPSVRQWYDEVAEVSDHPRPEIRSTAAWVMGHDVKSSEFRQALLRLLRDREPLVRRNAALSLVRFGDPSGRPELLVMLKSSDPEQVWEALRALYLVGKDEDLADIERIARDPKRGEELRQQARLAAGAIKQKRHRGTEVPSH